MASGFILIGGEGKAMINKYIRTNLLKYKEDRKKDSMWVVTIIFADDRAYNRYRDGHLMGRL